jgi:hypothetical protein
MREFDQIFLCWREGSGHSRHVVGVLDLKPSGQTIFKYIPENVSIAKKFGFSCYTEFSDISKTYTENVLEIFGQRLIKPERPDIKDFYGFWEINPLYKDDKFYLLGHTQGFSSTDNFEFLANYKIVPGLQFITDLAAMTHLKLPAKTAEVHDTLSYKFEIDNTHDGEAIKVFKGERHVGYIKKIHCKVFHKEGADKLKLTVKAVDQNGIIKRVFVKVVFEL